MDKLKLKVWQNGKCVEKMVIKLSGDKFIRNQMKRAAVNACFKLRGLNISVENVDSGAYQIAPGKEF